MSDSRRGSSRGGGAFPAGPVGKPRWHFPILLVSAIAPLLIAPVPSETRAGDSVHSEMQRQGVGGSSMWESHAGSLLVDYYEEFLRDRDLDQFRERVVARYTEGTLGRALGSSPSITARRGAVLALGVIGSFEQSYAALGRANPAVAALGARDSAGRLGVGQFGLEQGARLREAGGRAK